MTKLKPGSTVPDFRGTSARGTEISAESLKGKPVLLQFHRFATCPACFVTVRQFTRRVDELHKEGLEVVAFFYSTPEELAESFKDLAPDFELVGDPDRVIFDQFGVERSHRKLLDPRSIATGVSGWFKGAKFQPVANLTKEDVSGVPADFIVDAEGVLRHVHYGTHAADSLTVDEVLEAYRALTAAA